MIDLGPLGLFPGPGGVRIGPGIGHEFRWGPLSSFPSIFSFPDFESFENIESDVFVHAQFLGAVVGAGAVKQMFGMGN